MLVAETAPGFRSGDSARLAFNDERLVARVRAGDDEAFATLVRRRAPALLRVARRYVPSDQRVLLHRARVKVRPALEAWIDAA
jgi:hypothetical protein